MSTIQTPRLTLLSASVELLNAELTGAADVGRILRAQIPEDWPPGEYDSDAVAWTIAQLAIAGEEQQDWFAWYCLLNPEGEEPQTLIGCAGYFGPPNANGVVEIGYSICEGFRNRGFATEFSRALCERAFGFPEVNYVQVRTTPGNAASLRVIIKSGFVPADSDEPQYLRFVLQREDLDKLKQ